MKRACVGLVMVLAAACNRVDKDRPDPKPPGPQSPSELAIEASILSAVLADDCQHADAARAMKPELKNEEVKADMPDSKAKAKRACEQSRVQLLLKSGAGSVPARIEVVSVT